MQCCSGVGQFGGGRERHRKRERERDPFWSLKIVWRWVLDSGWRCTFSALEWDEVCGSTGAWKPQRGARKKIFLQCKPSRNLNFFYYYYWRRSLRSCYRMRNSLLFLKGSGPIVLSSFKYCWITITSLFPNLGNDIK